MKSSSPCSWSATLLVLLASACPGEDEGGPACVEDGSITLPAGFCATVFAEGIGPARHIAVSPSGDVFVAVADQRDGTPGGVVALRDVDGDGVSDLRETFAGRGGNGIAWHQGQLYFAQNDRIVRYAMPDGTLAPEAAPEVIVSGLPDVGDHNAKTVVVTDAGDLLVNIGSASNSCQVENRVPLSPGVDPCPELGIRAGIWRFDGRTLEQTQDDGHRYATGIRNANALALDGGGRLWAAQNGRDTLHQSWPLLYTEEDEQRLPSEEIFPVSAGADYGWPYCYHDPQLGHMVLAPEYGGDGHVAGRCASVQEPYATLPAHWAPLGMHFYRGDMFPERYERGMFVASHGGWHASDPVEPPGYAVVFIPEVGGRLARRHEPFAAGFAGKGRPLPDAAEHRPVGVAEAPDGSLYISDDVGGTIYRVYYRGKR